MFSSNAAQVSAANYVEDVFSTYLYTGTGANLTITNGIDLSTKGGLVWIKQRSGGQDHTIFDTNRGVNNYLRSNSTGAQNPGGTYTDLLTAFNTTGFSLGADASTAGFVNASGSTYVSWTFRKQAKFFDVVTYTGNGVSNRTVSHSLGSVPGCIFFKITSTTGDWVVLHQNNGTTPRYGYLNLTSAMPLLTGSSMSTFASSATFSPGALDSALNLNGATYVAYLFAHDAGGFGAAGSDNVISCGSFTTDGSGNATVSLGYEPQWLLVKNATTASNNEWRMVDNMRGFPVNDASSSLLIANLSAAETTTGTINLLNTGFQIDGLANSATCIYIAIRRGPMKTPTSGTSVFAPQVNTGTGSAKTQTVGFPLDLVITGNRSQMDGWTEDRLRGFSNTSTRLLLTISTAAESSVTTANSGVMLDGTTTGQVQYTAGSSNQNQSGYSYANWFFRRAPGFFDVVCYTGTGAVNTLNHNLGVVPEIWIIKRRTGGAGDWWVGGGLIGSGTNAYLNLNTTAANVSGLTNLWLTPTSTTFGIGSYAPTAAGFNASGSTYVAYLFATVAGVSKVGSYTGTAALQTINCGFSAGARFVLIKRTDSTGDWYVWDSARGISSGNDPYLLLNSTAAEVTGTNYVDTTSVGFQVTAAAPAGINASGGSYIFLAVS